MIQCRTPVVPVINQVKRQQYSLVLVNDRLKIMYNRKTQMQGRIKNNLFIYKLLTRILLATNQGYCGQNDLNCHCKINILVTFLQFLTTQKLLSSTHFQRKPKQRKKIKKKKSNIISFPNNTIPTQKSYTKTSIILPSQELFYILTSLSQISLINPFPIVALDSDCPPFKLLSCSVQRILSTLLCLELAFLR